METITLLPTLPPRPADANKGNFGRVLIVAGSRGMSGAAGLCGSAALRAGAGLVRCAFPTGNSADRRRRQSLFHNGRTAA